MTQSIVTLTMNPAVDKSATLDRVIPERKLRCGPPRFDPGGGGINVSRAIKKLGGDSLALYPSGGLAGKFLESLLDAEGLHHQPVPIEQHTRENFHVYEESTGQQFRFNLPGAELRESEWRRFLEILAGMDPKPDYLVLSGSLPPGVPEDFYAQAARLGRDIGTRIVIDTSGDPLRYAIEAGVYLLKPNLRELCALTGCNASDEASMAAAAGGIIKTGQAEVVVVSLEAAGALLITREGWERFATPPIRAVSKVGAGDSMVAGIVWSLARGWSPRDSVRYGVASGTAAVMRHGTQLCHCEDTDRLFAQMP
jgi:6-phosphofructokinase 2